MIREFGGHPRIASFSAFGDHTASLADQRRHRHEIKSMGERWAFCVPRARWLEYQRYYAAYLRYIRRVDYQMRSFVWITRHLYRRWGAKSDVSSQDGAKMIAGLRAGLVHISTYTNNGRYIGRRGVHFSPRIFTRLGYDARANLVFGQPEDRFDWTTADLDRIETILRSRFLPSPITPS